MEVVRDYTAIVALFEGDAFRWNSGVDVGTAMVVTYSFTETDDLADASISDPYGAASYISFSSAQRDQTRAAFSQFEQGTGLRFVEVDGPAMINLYGTPFFYDNIAGWGHYPWSSLSRAGGGDIVVALDQGGATYVGPGSFEYEVILHEIGHGLGLSHPHEGDLILASDLDNNQQTVMTYNFGASYADAPGNLDIDALQYIYGTADQLDGWTIGTARGGGVKITASLAGDTVLAPAQDSRVFGKGGEDTLIGREGDDHLFGGAGHDEIAGGFGRDLLNGQNGADTLTGGDGADSLYGGKGDDLLLGGSSASGYSGSAQDHLFGGSGEDTLYGGGGNDRLEGGGKADRLYGGDGFDVLYGNAGNDVLLGDLGTAGTGGSSKDELFGGTGKDTLYGDGGRDILDGGAGDDVLYGGEGRDRLIGGSGSDTFAFNYADRDAVDRILDFNANRDLIDLTYFDFAISSLDDISIRTGPKNTIITFSPGFGDYEIRLVGYTGALEEDVFLFG